VREVRWKSLSPTQQRLVLLLQALNFGEIRDLHVKDGQPVFEPRPDVVRSVRLGAENGPRPEIGRTDCTIKMPVLELLEEIRRLGDGRIQRIAVKHGLPTDLTVAGGFFDEACE